MKYGLMSGVCYTCKVIGEEAPDRRWPSPLMLNNHNEFVLGN